MSNSSKAKTNDKSRSVSVNQTEHILLCYCIIQRGTVLEFLHAMLSVNQLRKHVFPTNSLDAEYSTGMGRLVRGSVFGTDNTYARLVIVKKKPRVCLFAKRMIAPHEVLTWTRETPPPKKVGISNDIV